MITFAAIRLNGIVYTGKRHCEIMHDKSRPKGFLKFGEQGFTNDRNEFLTREQAAQEALRCGQINKLKYHSKELFSEEIFP